MKTVDKPDLLEAAKAMIIEIDMWNKRKHMGYSFDCDGADDMLRAAIAKAEGK